MKNIFLFCIILSISVHAMAQGDSAFIKYRGYKNEFGISINPLLDQFFNFHLSANGYNPTFPVPEYYVWYKRSLGNIALRGKLGGYISFEKDTGGYNSNSNVKQQDANIFFRPGIEWRHSFGRHWELSYGAEIISSYSYHMDHYDFSSLGPPKHTVRTWTIGGAPFLGASFILNSRLSLGTEALIDGFYQHYHGVYEYPDAPEDNTDELHKTAGVTFVYPVFIFVNIRF